MCRELGLLQFPLFTGWIHLFAFCRNLVDPFQSSCVLSIESQLLLRVWRVPPKCGLCRFLFREPCWRRAWIPTREHCSEVWTFASLHLIGSFWIGPLLALLKLWFQQSWAVSSGGWSDAWKVQFWRGSSVLRLTPQQWVDRRQRWKTLRRPCTSLVFLKARSFQCFRKFLLTTLVWVQSDGPFRRWPLACSVFLQELFVAFCKERICRLLGRLWPLELISEENLLLILHLS